MTSLKPETRAAFEAYVKAEEAKFPGMLGGPTPTVGMSAGALRPTDVVIKSMTGKGPVRVADGIIHDWVGSILVPGSSAQQALTTLQSYDEIKNLYKGEVLDSKLLWKQGKLAGICGIH